MTTVSVTAGAALDQYDNNKRPTPESTGGVWLASLVHADRGRHKVYLFDGRAQNIRRTSPHLLAASHDWLAARLARDPWFGPGPFVFRDEHRSATQRLEDTAVHCLAWAEGRLRGWRPLIAHRIVDGADDPDFAFVFPLATTAHFDRPTVDTYVFDLFASETLDMVWRYRYERMQRIGQVRPAQPPVAPTDAGEEKEALPVKRVELEAGDE
ncbi:hypothetical protein SEUCBS140593_010667 [Sporothrix eucalyptigena]|uniref:Uncharacterized protein n=1 Tax=Sporothrix eucalyptigena TaxID=1812306 RepID=A0ABP0D1Y0_9PEZI